MPDQNEIQAELVDDVQPFTMLQNAFIDDARVSPAAFRLFVTLKSYTSGRSTSKTAFPSYETIREKSGLGSYATIVRAIRELETLGWIVRVKRYGRSTLYTLRASPTVSVGLQKVKDQSYRNCRISPTETVEEQEVQKQEVLQQEVAAKRRAADAAVKAAGIGKMPSARVAKANTKKAEARSQYDLGELEDAPAIRVHRQVCGEQLITIDQAKRMIASANGTAETTWRERMRFWMGKGWRADTIDKHILYNETENKREEARRPKSTAPAFTPEQYADIMAQMEKSWA